MKLLKIKHGRRVVCSSQLATVTAGYRGIFCFPAKGCAMPVTWFNASTLFLIKLNKVVGNVSVRGRSLYVPAALSASARQLPSEQLVTAERICWLEMQSLGWTARPGPNFAPERTSCRARTKGAGRMWSFVRASSVT